MVCFTRITTTEPARRVRCCTRALAKIKKLCQRRSLSLPLRKRIRSRREVDRRQLQQLPASIWSCQAQRQQNPRWVRCAFTGAPRTAEDPSGASAPTSAPTPPSAKLSAKPKSIGSSHGPGKPTSVSSSMASASGSSRGSITEGRSTTRGTAATGEEEAPHCGSAGPDRDRRSQPRHTDTR